MSECTSPNCNHPSHNGLYDPAVLQQAIDSQAPTGQLIVPSRNVPECYKNSENLTLDQIDARNVRIEVAYKKSYRVPRARITNNVIRAYFHPHLAILMGKQLIALAVEARRRLRHPGNQPHVTPFKGPAWGTMKTIDEKIFDTLVVTIDGREVDRVTLGELTKELERKAKTKKEEPLVIPA